MKQQQDQLAKIKCQAHEIRRENQIGMINNREPSKTELKRLGQGAAHQAEEACPSTELK